jgi:hypothetical protein
MSPQVLKFLTADHTEQEREQLERAVSEAESKGYSDYYIYGYNSWYHIQRGQILGQGKNGPLVDSKGKVMATQPPDPAARDWRVYKP